MRELSLFTGAGGGLLGTHLLGWEPCGYVEWNEYCQKVIAARIRDGYLREAPIFTDVREFVQSGAARQYRGIADVVTAGFPCQPFSVAGKQAGADDERNMWPATRDVIRDVQPGSVLLENVRGLISCGYLGTVIGDLADLGYVGRWGVISAADCGAPHRRDRLWIVGHTNGSHSQGRGLSRRMDSEHADADQRSLCRDAFRQMAYSERIGQPGPGKHGNTGNSSQNGKGQTTNAFNGSWWTRDPGDDVESGVGRVAHGVAHRLERLKAIGNGQVSIVAARAWQELS